MSENQPAHQPIPFLKGDEEKLSKVRRQLENVFEELRLVEDVIMLCCGICEHDKSSLESEMEHILRRCGSNRIHGTLKTLTQIIERFGGTTGMSEAANCKSVIDRAASGRCYQRRPDASPHNNPRGATWLRWIVLVRTLLEQAFP